jgi:L-alanine-DL-glutamate epimerase-like enolase superfamily enzyme
VGHRGRVTGLEAAAYTVPTDAPEADGTLEWNSTTVVVVHARSGGHTGLGWTYAPAACAQLVRDLLEPAVVGRDVMDLPAMWLGMVRAIRNATRAGVAGYALSAVDVALWDLKARALDLPLTSLLGRAHDSVPVYGSGGFTTYDEARMVAQLAHWVQVDGVRNVKIKVAQDGGGAAGRDLERIQRARAAIGSDVGLFIDANGGYQRKQAIRLWRSVIDEGVTWFEEPVSSDDLAGLRQIRGAIDADVTAGEYGSDIVYFRRMCEAGAVDCLQIDATRAGGYTEWLRAAAVAASHGLEVSGHCAPALHAPIAAATPNLRHLEWFHDHVRIEQMLFDGVQSPRDGLLPVDSDQPGHGYRLRADAAERYPG